MKLQPRKPPRYQQDYSTYFLTFCTFKRLPILHEPGIPEFLVEELYFYEKKILKLVAYTIMPDHVHLMVEVENVKALSAFLRDFKKYTSAVLLKRLASESGRSRRSSDRRAEVSVQHRSDDRLLHLSRRSNDRLLHLDRVWQPGTMDHCIRMNWNGKDYENHLSYIFYNSYKHLGIAPKDFPYHNFMKFVEQGYFDEDFCSVDEKIDKGLNIYE